MFQWLLSKLFNKEVKKDREETMHRFVGIFPDQEDKRDFLNITNAPALRKYLIPEMPPVRNQQNLSSCCSHAVIGAYEIMQLNKNPRRYLEGSELYHYYNARKNINNTFPNDNGMTIRDGCKTIAKYNMAIEYAWAYTPANFNVEPPWFVYAISGAYKIKLYERLLDLGTIKKVLTENIPVIVGIYAYQSIFHLSQSDYLYKPSGDNRGGHAVLIVGYDDDRGVFIIRNSWGQYWGNKGYFEMSYSDFNQYSFDTWVLRI